MTPIHHAFSDEFACRPRSGNYRAPESTLRWFFTWTLVLAALVLAYAGTAGAISDESADQKGTGGAVAADTNSQLDGRLIVGQIPLESASAMGSAEEIQVVASDEPLPTGSRIISFYPAVPSPGIKNLTDGFVAAGRPDVSFDGTRVLFVAKEATGDRFAVWEMNGDGSGLRQVTRRAGDALQAIYLHTLFGINSDRPELRIALLEASVPEGPASLHTCRSDGTDCTQITYNPLGVYDPLLLSDGRLLYSSRRAPEPGSEAEGGSVLFTVFPDGTDVFVFTGNHGPQRYRGMPCETNDGGVVFVESPVGRRDRGGSLIRVARSRSLHTRRVLTAVTEGTYRSPRPLRGNRLLVSFRPKRGGSYGVFVVDPASGTRVEKVFDDRSWHDLDAAMARPRRTPAGRSSVVDDSRTTGLLYCLNAYESNLGSADDELNIDRVQVWQAGSLGPGGPGAIRKEPIDRLLGEAPVEADGSFFLELPARTPVRLQTVDKNGEALQAMRSWIWVMPNEARGCIGCHEDRELTPPNRHVLALRRRPTKIGSGRKAIVPANGDPGSPGDRE